MIKKNKIHKFKTLIIIGLIATTFSMGACNTNTLTTITESVSAAVENSEDSSDTSEENSVSENTGSSQSVSEVESMDVTDMFSDRDMENEFEESECTTINLDKESIEGSGAEVTSEGITITEEGEYILTGTYKNKKIIVEAAEDAKVRLILKDADIENEKGAAIYVKSADKVFVTLAKGSSNTVTGVTQTISDEEETDGAIYSKSDLTINGEGTLSVKCSDGKGIVSKDDLKITSGNINVESLDHAISGKDSVRIAGGTIKVKAGEDGIHSGNDEDPEKGNVYIADGNIEIDVSDDGIHAESKTVIANGTINIINSEEGIEGAIVEIAGGVINVNSNDDGINATDGSGSSDIGGFIQGDFDPAQSGGFIQGDFDPTQFEGSEPPEFNATGEKPSKPGGMHPGFNETTGEMPSGFGENAGDNQGKPGFEENTANVTENDVSIDLTQSVYILISGGDINVNASGDGLDSNGSIYVTGGNVSISGPENNGNGAIDYNSKAVITGGSFIACGSSGMAMNFNAASQGCILLNLSEAHKEGEEVTVTDSDSNVILQFTPLIKYESILLSCEELKEGSTYTITAGDESKTVTIESMITGNMGAKGGR